MKFIFNVRVSALSVFLILFLFCLNQPVSAQGGSWTPIDREAITESTLNSVHFVDAQTGWAVGPNGTIVKTVDGGTTWTTQTSGTDRNLLSVHFVDAQIGWAVGFSGTIVNTVDGGTNWTTQDSGTGSSLRSVHFVDAQTGWAVGSFGTIVNTVDGGTTWTTQDSGTGSLYSVHFVDAETGWAVGANRLNSSTVRGTIMYTVNGGESWTSGNIGTDQHLYSVHFVDAETGWAVGLNGTIVKTVDGGKSWQVRDSWTAQTSGTNVPLFSVHFVDAQTGWAVGAGGTIVNTVDGGTTWTTQTSRTDQHLYSVHFVDAQTGWAVGGTILTYGTFTFTLDLTAPTGGENWAAGSLKEITWTSEGTSHVRLEYSPNNGVSWSQIAASVPVANGSHTWNVPKVLGSQSRIRISDAYDASIADTSGAFTIFASLDLTAPTGGEYWTAGSYQEITWTSEGISHVRLEYSPNNGVSWSQIIDSVPAANGSHTWIVPKVLGNQSRIRISDASDASIADTSGAFTIFASLDLTAPTGGEYWRNGSLQEITWTSEGISQVRLEYSPNNGVSWSQIAAPDSATIGTYAWTVDSVTGSQTRIRISDASDASIADTSGAFTIYALSLTNPNGGQVWSSGSQRTISWNSQGLDTLQLRLEYTLNAGATWLPIAESVPAADNSYVWTVPNANSSNVKVRISGKDIPEIHAESDAVFTITRGYVELLPDTVIIQKPSYINAMFHALDQNGIGIPNLTEDEFVITENDQVISDSESFKQIGKADKLNYTLRTVLVLDNSFSLTPEDLAVMKQAAITFVENKQPDQLIAVYEFSESVTLRQDFTSDEQSIINAINAIQRGFPSTNLYGAIITGLSRWNDAYSLTDVDQGVLVIFTDGADTQGSSTLDQVFADRGSKRVITVGLGNDINPTVLQQIGNAGFYRATEAGELTEQFLVIQQNLIKFTESFYWLNYITPKRGDNEHTLQVSLRGNVNTSASGSFSTQFNSSGFYSVFLSGITINSSAENLMGIDTLHVGANSPTDIALRVPFTFDTLDFSIEGEAGDSLTLVKKEGETNTYILTAYGAVGETKSVTIKEAVYGYSKTVTLKLTQSTDIPGTSEIPLTLELSQNYPNPFNPTTVIHYQIPESGNTRLAVYDLIGRQVALLVNETMPSGSYSVNFDGSGLASGIYIYRLQVGDQVFTRKMMLVK